MRDLFSEIMEALRHNKLRTALTGLSVSWGIFMLIVLLGLARGMTNNFEENMSNSSQARIEVWSGRTSKPYKGNREGRYIEFRSSDMQALKDEHEDFVENVSSIIYGNSLTMSIGSESVQAGLTGVYPDNLRNRGISQLLAGRNITDRDLKTRAKVLLLPKEYATLFFPGMPPDAIIGRRANCGGLSFTIVGVYDGRFDRSIYIPFTTAQMMAEKKDEVGALTVNLRNVSTEEDGMRAEDGVRNTLAQLHTFDPKDESALWISNRFVSSLKGAMATGILNMSVWILGVLTLLTGVVGISNIMFVSVRERTHEIGIRRAIGAKPRSILTQVIAESVAITVLFGYIGIVLGTAVTQGLSLFLTPEQGFRNPTVSLSIALQVTAVLVIAGALAGMFPAMRALKVKPVEALRDE
ncbi:MAG: ABC transporter permease [Muribaculaceae bacterium]|nr:ABC transporter permease [Muribaculaceae bacterium]